MIDREYIEKIRKLSNTILSISDWYAFISASERIKEKLSKYTFTTVTIPAKLDEPVILHTSDGRQFSAFFINDALSRDFIDDFYISWIIENRKAIREEKINFLFVEDTGKKRYEQKMANFNLMYCMVARRTEQLYHRETLLASLQHIVDKIPQLDLPWTIDEVHVFGSIVREERVHDVDAYVTVHITPEQQLRIDMIYMLLGQVPFGDGYKMLEGYDSLGKDKFMEIVDRSSKTPEIKKQLRAFALVIERGDKRSKDIIDILFSEFNQRRGVRFDKIIDTNARIRDLLEEAGYPLEWFKASVSRTSLIQDSNRITLLPSETKIIPYLLKRNVQGFQTFKVGKPNFTKVSVLAWSPSKPNVWQNIVGRSDAEKLQYLKAEFDGIYKDIQTFHEDNKTGGQPAVPAVSRSGNETMDELAREVKMLRSQLKNMVLYWRMRGKIIL